MTVFLIILFVIECGAFCYLFYEILEIKKEIDTLYENYSKELEKITKINLDLKSIGRKCGW